MDDVLSASGMGGSGSVRPATDADEAPVVAAGLLSAGEAASVFAEHRSGTLIVIVAEAMGRHLGALSLRVQPDRHSATVASMGVVSGAWTNSIIQALLSRAEEVVQGRRIDELRLERAPSSANAVAVLRRLGFEQIQSEPDDLSRGNALHLRKKLTRKRTRIRHAE